MFDNIKIDRNSTVLVAEQIEQLMLLQIKKGLIKPGTKLASTKDLASKWNVNPLSVQKAMKNLTKLGLLDRRAKHGTFLRSCTPNVVNIALLCHGDLSADFTSYNRLIVASMRKVFLKQNWHSFIYDRFPNDLDDKSIDEAFVYKQFIKDVSNGIVNSYVEISLGESLNEKRDKLGIPFVRISQMPAYTDIMFDYKKLAIDTIRHSIELGRKQICIIGGVSIPGFMNGFNEVVEKLNIPAPEIPIMTANNFMSSTAHAENELFNKFTELVKKWVAEDNIPETLIVADDMAMKIIALVLLKEQIPVPEKMLVISQANEGIDIFYGLPVLKYEFPSLAMSNMAVNILKARMQGKKDSNYPIMVEGHFQKSAV